MELWNKDAQTREQLSTLLSSCFLNKMELRMSDRGLVHVANKNCCD